MDCPPEPEFDYDDEWQQQMIEKRKYESYEKVMSWFRRNDRINRMQYEHYVEIKSDKSGGSDEENLKEIKTPPNISGSSDHSNESKNKNEELVSEQKQEEQQSEHVSLFPGIIYNVNIINFESPDLFQVTIKSDYDEKWNKLLYRLKKIKELGRLEPLDNIKTGSLCLLLVNLNDELQRAVVQKAYLSYVICYGIDDGKVHVVDNINDKKIYKMTPEIRNTVDFQAINCKMHEVSLPIQPGVNEMIYDMFITKMKRPQIKVMEVINSKFLDDRCEPLKQYDVILIDDADSSNINQKISARF